MKPIAPPMLPIERACKDLADVREDLASTVSIVNAAIEAAVRVHRRKIVFATGSASGKTEHLFNLVKENAHLFEDPKTFTFHGIKVGYRKASGKLVIADEEETVRLIKKHYSENEANALLHITITPNKEAIEKLSGAEMKKIAVSVEAGGNVPLVKPVDTSVDALVKALLKGAIDEATSEREAA